MRILASFIVSLLVLFGITTHSFAQGSAEKGKKVFRKCAACHAVGDKARNKVGPIMNDIIGRQAGTVEKYRYSKINQAAGEAGLIWTPENIAAYLPDPQKFLANFLKEKGEKASGRTKMAYRLRKEDEIADVIAYLKTYSKPVEEAPAATEEQPAAAEGEKKTN